MKMMQVLPNPYRSLDADGKPTAIVPCHPRHAPGEFVGAMRELVVLKKATTIDVKRVVNGRTVIEPMIEQLDRSKASFTFSQEPVQVPAEGAVGAYYRDRVREGSLVPADQKTAQACGITFEPVDQVLVRERDAAAKAFQVQFGTAPEWANLDTKPAPAVAPK